MVCITSELIVDFSRRFTRGPVIQASFRQLAEGSSIIALFGPSGGGKSTILKCLAGLERPDEGMIRFGDESWFDAKKRIFLTPQKRDIGYLFQEHALFPHMRVESNIAYGLNGLSKEDKRKKVAEMLDLFGLKDTERRFPHQISGGQKQRVALARVLVRRPRLLLLDEPFSALDVPLREEIRPELRRILKQFNIPVLLVTHDRNEVIALGDGVIIVDEGQIRQTGAVHEVFNRPVDMSVARIVGMETVVPGRVTRAQDGLATVAIGDKELVAVSNVGVGCEVEACIRAADVVLQKGITSPASARNHLQARVQSVVSDGALVRVILEAGFPLTALVTHPACEELGIQPGATLTVLIKAHAIHLIPRS